MAMLKIIIISAISTFCSVYMSGQSACTIQIDKDKFTDDISIKTQVASAAGINPLIFGKQIKGKDTTYYLHFYLKQQYGSYSAKGAFVIFNDSTRWQKPEAKVNVDYLGSNVYSYEVYLMLSIDDAKRLGEHKITDVKIYTAVLEIKDKEAENLKCAVKKVLESTGN